VPRLAQLRRELVHARDLAFGSGAVALVVVLAAQHAHLGLEVGVGRVG
jgi:hypothetical protein